MAKRGQFQISFGMIFSIIIIIAIFAISGYVIYKVFLPTSQCIEIGLFYDPLEKYINKAWGSTIHRGTFTGTLPSGIEQVCFGDINLASGQYGEVVRDFINSDGNVFLFPPYEACDSALASKTLKHVQIENFFCIPVVSGKIKINTEKTQFDSLVSIKTQ
jgi:hypothetical protein